MVMPLSSSSLRRLGGHLVCQRVCGECVRHKAVLDHWWAKGARQWSYVCGHSNRMHGRTNADRVGPHAVVGNQ